MKDIEYCDNCPFFHKINKTSGLYADTYCSYGVSDTDNITKYKTLNTWIYVTNKTIKPSHCPKNCKKMLPKYYKWWESAKGFINWDNIMVGKVYHIPPINGNNRMDVRVISKSQYMMNIKVLRGDEVGKTISLYPESIEVKFFCENKIVQYVSKN